VTEVNALPAEREYIEFVVATLCVWFHDPPDAGQVPCSWTSRRREQDVQREAKAL